MDCPFRSWYDKPAPKRRSSSYHPSLFGMPVYPIDPTRQNRHSAYDDGQPPVEKKPGRKVVQIPVQFLGSDSDRRSESALKIQKVFRGFLVRKSVGKIKEIKSHVDEIEVRLSRNEVVEMVKKNERERLRVSESLMNLLLKLDGIRGIDCGIRVCRKGVTSKVIGLQEKIDAICATESEGNGDAKMEIGNQQLENGVPAAELVGIERPAENGAAAELEGSRFGNTESSNDLEEMLDQSGEELKGSNCVPQEYEKMEVLRDFVHTTGLDAMVASKVNRSEETCLKRGFSGDFDKEMLVQNKGEDKIKGEGKLDDDTGSFKLLANSDDLGEISGDRRDIFEGGNDAEVEDETMEVERNHLDAEIIDVPVTTVEEANRETCPVKGTPNNLDFDKDNAETVDKMLVERTKMEGRVDDHKRDPEFWVKSDDDGEILGDSKEELEGGSSVEVQDRTMEVEGDQLDTKIVDVPVASVATSSQESGPERVTPKNLVRDENSVGTMKEMPDEKKGVESKRKGEMLERMMEDNKRAMLMMAQLYDGNQMQLQMLDALSNRVELLEKAYLCDKLRNRRKKMKKNKRASTGLEY